MAGVIRTWLLISRLENADTRRSVVQPRPSMAEDLRRRFGNLMISAAEPAACRAALPSPVVPVSELVIIRGGDPGLHRFARSPSASIAVRTRNR